jgi:hypothetical protein
MSESQSRTDDSPPASGNDLEDIKLFERLADRYADRQEGRAFALAAQSLREER